MTRYTVRRYNSIAKAWSISLQTYCMFDAYQHHAYLIKHGYQASISSEYVEEGNEG